MKPAKGKDDKKPKVKIKDTCTADIKNVKNTEEYIAKHAHTLHSYKT